MSRKPRKAVGPKGTKAPVLIVGGSGVFGSRLARRLIAAGETEVIVAGRDAAKLEAFVRTEGCRSLVMDREGDVDAALAELRPFVVVDAAGPFQAYGTDPYRLARAAMAAGAHYLDFSDDAAFTAGITALDAEAKAAGVVLRSGVSSVPAISAAAVRELAAGLTKIDSIESVILPGNRAPRGLSVVRAIVGQAGRPLPEYQGGRWTNAPAWGGLRRERLAVGDRRPLDARWSSRIGAPDLRLFPAAFSAGSVTFRAGLELPVLHLGLSALAWLVRLRLMATLAPLARPLHRIAGWFERMGSDRGGMRVTVVGVDAKGQRLRRRWTLLAEAGAGPEIPAIPAFVLIGRLLRQKIGAGAAACIDVPALAEIEAVLLRPAMHTARSERAAPVLYERVLGSEFARLPPALRALHAVVDEAHFAGRARIDVGPHPLARLIGGCMRFPPAADDVAVEVRMRVEDGREHWQRCFGRHRFESVLSKRKGKRGAIKERFGALSFDLALVVTPDGLAMPLRRGRCLGIPLPRWLTPESRTREFVDDQGRASFDVEIVMPWIGSVIRYRGWLLPLRDDPGRPLA